MLSKGPHSHAYKTHTLSPPDLRFKGYTLKAFEQQCDRLTNRGSATDVSPTGLFTFYILCSVIICCHQPGVGLEVGTCWLAKAFIVTEGTTARMPPATCPFKPLTVPIIDIYISILNTHAHRVPLIHTLSSPSPLHSTPRPPPKGLFPLMAS